ncbi:MAG TPA: LysM peptidoglycan-binding domain-containing protein [Paludibacteraceae bacterium]|nr:LysM peptidoglycan-binding domain-containing protein [Paludibacteraceae bacterium]
MKKALTIILFISLATQLSANYKKPVVTDNQRNDTVILPDLSKITLKDSIINYGKIYLSLPYRYGGTTPKGFDCSGFTSHVYGNFGINLNRSSREQASQFPEINKENLQTGDLVFFEGRRHNGVVGHVGIVTETKPNGEFNFIHSSIKKGVTISSSEEQYYASRYVKGGRVMVADNTLVKPSTKISLDFEKDNKPKYELVPKNKKQKLVEAKYHKVKKGETLSSIAEDYDVPVSTLKYLNGLKNSKIRRGKKLIISQAVYVSPEPTLDQLQTVASNKVEETEPAKVVLHYASMSPTPSLEIKEPELKPVSKENIKLKDEPKPVIQLNNAASTTEFYKVKAGESLYNIARTHNLTVDKLKEINNLKSNNITPGQLLAIKPAETLVAKTEQNHVIKNASAKTKEVVMADAGITETKKHELKAEPATTEKKAEKQAIKKPESTVHVVKKGDTLYSLSRQYGCKVAKIKEWNKDVDDNLQIGDKIKIVL